jgi:beta-glucanase (GH16 family)
MSGLFAERFSGPGLDRSRWLPYAVDWDADEARFTVDGEVVRRCARPPTYPMQLMLAVFDFRLSHSPGRRRDARRSR